MVAEVCTMQHPLLGDTVNRTETTEEKVKALQFLISIGDYDGITDGFKKITSECNRLTPMVKQLRKAQELNEELTAEIATLTAERDTLAAKCEQLQDALKDMLSGWRYIRQDPKHIDIYGVGWDRAQHGAEAALAAQQEGRAE